MTRSTSDILMDFKVRTEVVVPEQRVAEVLTGAFEGGSNYWLDSLGIVDDGKKTASAHHIEDWGRRVVACLYGKVTAHASEDDGIYTINREAIQRGLEFMSMKHPSHFSDLINENDDAETSDVLLQMVLFGDIVYG